MLVNKPTVFLKGFTQTIKDGFLSKLGWGWGRDTQYGEEALKLPVRAVCVLAIFAMTYCFDDKSLSNRSRRWENILKLVSVPQEY